MFCFVFCCNCRICTQEKFQYNCCASAITRFTGRKRVRKNRHDRHDGAKKSTYAKTTKHEEATLTERKQSNLSQLTKKKPDNKRNV